jgi:hypothetical protein
VDPAPSADGDWTGDERERLLIWLQGVLLPGAARRLPVHAAAMVLSEALARVGRPRPTQLSAVVPLRAVVTDQDDVALARDWFALSDPDRVRPLVVEIDGGDDARVAQRGLAVLRVANELTGGVLTLAVLDPDDRPELARTAPLAGGGSSRHRLAFACTAPEWSLRMGAWLVELLVDACRHEHIDGSITVHVRDAGATAA